MYLLKPFMTPQFVIQAACREAGGAKPKVLINLSLNGIKVADIKTKVCTIVLWIIHGYIHTCIKNCHSC